MEIDLTQLVIAIFGGGSVTGLAIKLWQIVKEHRTGQLQREDTTIARWQGIAERAEREQAEVEGELRWYRRQYAELWTAYMLLPPAEKKSFPSVPPPPPRRTRHITDKEN